MQTSTLQIEESATILKVLGDKTRLTMLKMLETHDYCVCEFVEIFKISQPAISQHVRKLKSAGLVCENKKGQWVLYSLNKSSEFYTLVQSLLDYLPNQDFHLQELKKQGIRILCD